MLCSLFSHKKLCLYLISIVSIKNLKQNFFQTNIKKTSFNILISIVITELLLNLVSCHGFAKKPNSSVILNSRSRLVNNYLAKGLYVIEKDPKQLSILPNYVKLRINVIDQLEKYLVMAKKINFLCSKHHKNCI